MKTVEYADQNGNLFEGVLYTPSNLTSPTPAVIVFPAFRGITDFEKSKAKELAHTHNYISFVADLYGQGIRPSSRETAFATMVPLVSDRPGVLKDRLTATWNTVANLANVDSSRICAIGFCFGGLCALDMARHGMSIIAAISYHGRLSAIPGMRFSAIPNTTISVHHGDSDSHVPFDEVTGFLEEMRSRKADFIFSSYSNALHSFTEPEADLFNAPGVGYNQNAARRSWDSTLSLLSELFSKNE